MSVDPTLPLRDSDSEAPEHIPPPIDPWSQTTSHQPVPPAVPPRAEPDNHPAHGGGGRPVDGPPPAGPGPVIARFGEMTVTSTLVHTPVGDLPLAGTQWDVGESWQSEQKTPNWAIVAAVVGFCVLTVFSLFFLLVKETTHHGIVQIRVVSGTHQYVVRMPVRSQVEVQQINQQVNYVRSLAAL